MSEIENLEKKDYEDYKYKLTPFKLFVKRAFPYFETNFDAMTNWELFGELSNYLNEIRENQNTVQENQGIVQENFDTLFNYVNDYFDNLDVQEEINNKLDIMVQEGELQQIINIRFNYLENEIQAVASGSPAGVYATLLQLQSADPNHSKIYVVAENGNWYYYNTQTSAWTSGGEYQASVNQDILNNLIDKVGTLVENVSGSMTASQNKVFPIKLKSGDKLQIKTTGDITIWTHSDINVSTEFDVERLDYLPIADSGRIFDITQNADFIRIYASNTAVFTAEVINKKIPQLEILVEKNEKDINNIDNELNNIDNSIKQIEKNFLIKHNLFEEINEGHFYSCWTVGQVPILDSSANYVCGMAKVEKMNYISFNDVVNTSFSCYADKEHKKISGLNDYRVDDTNTYIVPENAVYVYYSSNSQAWRTNGIVVVEGNKNISNPPVNATEYPYNTRLYYGDDITFTNGLTLKDISENSPHIIHIEKDGTGDFNKLIDGINYAVNYKNSIVYVGAGVWDIIEEYGNEIETMSKTKRGLYLKNGIHVICSSKALIVAKYTGTNNTVREWFSAFNAGVVGFTLENATIETDNIRYSIHDERDSDSDTYTNKYINCNFKHTNGFYKQCIGGGLGLDGRIIVEDCIFEGDNTSTKKILLSYHNSTDGGWDDTPSQNAQSFIDIHGNYFVGNSTIQLIRLGKSEKITTALVHNNSVGSAIELTNSSSLYYHDNIDMRTYNNEVRN